MDNKKDKKISEIIKKLSKREIGNEQEYELMLGELSEIYDDESYRHRYDEVTTMILNIPNIYAVKNEGELDPLEIIPQNLRSIYDVAKEKNISKNVIQKIEKLLVHVCLECERAKKFRGTFEKIKSIEEQEKKIVEKLEKQQTQYVTILGIFAAIVLAFVGALTFSTSVLAHIHESSIYRLVFVVGFIALFIGNILNCLFELLAKIALNEKRETAIWKQPIFYLNICILLIMATTGAVYCYFSP